MYLDHFASARTLLPAARARMQTLLFEGAGNPSSAHSEGRKARKILREARAEVATALGASPDEVVFVSGVTEALATSVHGLLLPHRLRVVACSQYEHSALREALVDTGCKLDTFAYDSHGKPIGRVNAGLVAIALVNHETGMRASLDGVCAMASGAPVVVDAAQATAYARDVWADERVSALCLSSHKIGGPTGAGALLVRKGLPFSPLLRGGPQEHELRAGTEAVLAAAGFARALSSYLSDGPARVARLRALTEQFEAGLKSLQAVRIVADDRTRAPGVTAAYALAVPARGLVEDLDARGIRVGAGAACAAHTNEPSSVLTALGLSRERALEVFRVSFSGDERSEDVTELVHILKDVIGKRRGSEGHS